MTTTITTPTFPTAATMRALHLVDLENLCGDPVAPRKVALRVLDDYLRLAGWRPGDHVRVAANPRLLRSVAWDLPVPANQHAVTGEDGADMMLLAHEPPELVARRFGRLVVGSGDHLFAARARATRDLGVPVVVVARPGSLSHELVGEGFGIRLLDPATTDAVVLAV
jgi:hypothetical protein